MDTLRHTHTCTFMKTHCGAINHVLSFASNYLQREQCYHKLETLTLYLLVYTASHPPLTQTQARIHICLEHAITCVLVNDWWQCHHGGWRILAPAGAADILVLPQGCLTVQKIKAGELIKTHLECVASECSNLDVEQGSDLLLQTVRQQAEQNL